MGKANSVFVAYCAKAFLASVISAPRAASFTDLAARVAEKDKTTEHVNRNLPDGKKSLANAELVARQLKNFFDGTGDVPRITRHMRLPAFRYVALEPYIWPPARK
jgi:hypothetical protein